jgi:hypothetical protein
MQRAEKEPFHAPKWAKQGSASRPAGLQPPRGKMGAALMSHSSSSTNTQARRQLKGGGGGGRHAGPAS